MKDKFWMVVTINGEVSVDSDADGRPHLYNEKDAQLRVKELALMLGSNHYVCLMEAMHAEVGEMTTKKIIFQRPTNLIKEDQELCNESR